MWVNAVRRLRPLLMIVIAGALAALVVSTSGVAANAANAQDFRDGSIISDSVFFNSGTMDAGQVQSFLNSKVPTCRSGYTCMKDYQQGTWSRPADPMCSAYQGAANESAAEIIVKVGRACGINPQVIIVLLQKEQSLVTDTWPTARQYRSATGYGCPDTADCDSEYYGFFNQVYKGAWALKRYTQPAGTGPGTEWNTRFDLSYPVGRTSNILYNPNSGCGTKPVYVQNQATHSLYIYTPYTPNQSALNAGYGVGDGCGSYGNRNFFLFFTDYFGSTGLTVAPAFLNSWAATGGSSGTLGEPTSVERFDNGGRWQTYRGGALTQRDGAGVISVDGEMGARYLAIGAGVSGIGLPTGGVEGLTGGTRQVFQRGILYWTSAAHAWEVDNGETGAAYARVGNQSGVLGYPVGPNQCGMLQNGCYQSFATGSIHWTPTTGAHATSGAIRDYWASLGWEGSFLGYPTGDASTTNGVTTQAFQGGQVRVVNGVASWIPAAGPIGDAYTANGTLGSPVTMQKCGLLGSGCYQEFANGSIHWTQATGAHATSGAVRTYWASTGWESGVLGYPTGDAVTSGALTTQEFQGGQVRVTGGVASYAPVAGPIRDAYLAAGNLGAPTGRQQCWLRDGGCFQEFANGSIHWTAATGAHATSGAMRAYWASQGWEGGPLGFPTGDASTSSAGTVQQFQGQTVYLLTNGTVYTVDRGQTGAEYARVGGQTGVLGWPTMQQRCGLLNGGCYQEFQNGSIHWNAATGAHATWAGVRSYWASTGWEGGALGYPSGDAVTSSSGMVQQFQRQTVYVPTSGATQTVDRGDTGAAYARAGGQTGVLGWPTAPQRCGLLNGGCYQDFQNGSIHWNGATGAHATSGAIRTYWASTGWEGGPLGYPATDAVTTNGVTTQDFQGGRVTLSGGQVTVGPR